MKAENSPIDDHIWATTLPSQIKMNLYSYIHRWKTKSNQKQDKKQNLCLPFTAVVNVF